MKFGGGGGAGAQSIFIMHVENCPQRCPQQRFCMALEGIALFKRVVNTTMVILSIENIDLCHS